MELSLGQGLILYTLFVAVFTAGIVEAVRTVRKTRRIMREIENEVDE